MTFKQLIDELSLNLDDNSDILYLIEEIANLSYSHLIMKLNDEVDKDIEDKIRKSSKLYLVDSIPPQYILGYAYFYGMKLVVNNDVLIPRKETEELIEHLLAIIDNKKNYQILDIGCGSGAIGLSLKKELPNSNVYLSDISPKALEIAKRNSELNHLDVHFILSDMLDEIDNKFDIIVSNPPYISKIEDVDSMVYNNEPHLALFAGKDGLFFYERILKDLNKVIIDEAIIAFEHGYDQKDQLNSLIKEYYPNVNILNFKDLSGNDRIIIFKVKK